MVYIIPKNIKFMLIHSTHVLPFKANALHTKITLLNRCENFPAQKKQNMTVNMNRMSPVCREQLRARGSHLLVISLTSTTLWPADDAVGTEASMQTACDAKPLRF